MEIIIKGIVANLSLLISTTYLLSKVSKEPINYQVSLFHKMLQGIFSGLSGVALMSFSIPAYEGLLIDIRLVPIVMASTSVGGIAPLIAATIIGVARLGFGITPLAISVCVTYIFIGISQFFISNRIHKIKGRIRFNIIFITVLLPTIFNFIYFNHRGFAEVLAYILFFGLYNSIGAKICFQFARDLQISKYNYFHYENISKKDHLTNIPNRYLFDQTLANYYHTNHDVTLLLFDINKFKLINDTYGHDVGDLVLKKFSATLLQQCAWNEQVFRLGGDEFAIVYPRIIEEPEYLQLMHTIKRAVNVQSVHLNKQQKAFFQTSIGYSNSRDCPTSDTLYKAADINLYADKKS